MLQKITSPCPNACGIFFCRPKANSAHIEHAYSGYSLPKRDSIHRSISDYQLELDSALTGQATTAGLKYMFSVDLLIYEYYPWFTCKLSSLTIYHICIFGGLFKCTGTKFCLSLFKYFSHALLVSFFCHLLAQSTNSIADIQFSPDCFIFQYNINIYIKQLSLAIISKRLCVAKKRS